MVARVELHSPRPYGRPGSGVPRTQRVAEGYTAAEVQPRVMRSLLQLLCALLVPAWSAQGAGVQEMGLTEPNALQDDIQSFNSSARKLLVLPKGGVSLKKLQEVEDCTIKPEYVQYTLDRIANAPLNMVPYPHVYITKIFHQEFYACLLAHLPERSVTDEVYSRYKKTQRYQMEFSGCTREKFSRSSCIDKIDQRKINATFWKDFATKFSGPEMTRVWLSKFQTTVGNREVDWRKNEDQFWYSLKLGRDFKGYEIGPHTDTLDKWVTTLYYLASDDSHPEVGTVVVKSKSGRTSLGPDRGKLSDKDFEVLTLRSSCCASGAADSATCTSRSPSKRLSYRTLCLPSRHACIHGMP